MSVKFDRALYKSGKKASSGYGQIEPNQVWFTRAGMVEAQCALDDEKFSDSKVSATATSAEGKIVAQNGAFLMVDKANQIVTIPNEEMSKAGYPMGINYSSEKIYDTSAPQRRNFCLTTNDWMPRIGYVQPGMRFTTNTVQWDETTYSSYTTTDDSYDFYNEIKDTLDEGTSDPIYAVVTADSDGELVIGADPANALGNVYTQVVKAYTNADKTCSFMFQVINKPTE